MAEFDCSSARRFTIPAKLVLVGALVLGSLDSQYVRADVRCRMYPNREDSADGNWLTVQIDLVAGPFAGSYSASWRAEFIPPFRAQVEELYRTLEGTATFVPDWERSLTITLTGDGRGHVAIEGTACPDVGARGPELRFWMPSIDQTFLPALIDEVHGIEKEFPAVAPDARIRGDAAPNESVT